MTERSKRTGALKYVETTTGNYYLPTDAHGDIVANAIAADQIHDEEIVRVAQRYIRPASIVLDVGANFGQMSVLFADSVGPDGKVYSFEADDFVFEILTKNVSANAMVGRIIPVFGAVHHLTDQMLYFPVQDFVRFGSYGSYGIDYNACEGRRVRSLTIDSMAIERPISFMKIDIQGGDLLAMRGAIRTIMQNRMPIVFEYEYRFEDEFKLDFQEYVDFIQLIDYKFAKVINGQNYLVVPRNLPRTDTA